MQEVVTRTRLSRRASVGEETRLQVPFGDEPRDTPADGAQGAKRKLPMHRHGNDLAGTGRPDPNQGRVASPRAVDDEPHSLQQAHDLLSGKTSEAWRHRPNGENS